LLNNIFLLYLFQDSGVGTPVTLRVDKNGFYLYWVDQNKVRDFFISTFMQEINSIKARLCRQKLIFVWIIFPVTGLTLDLLVDPRSILDKWKNYFSKLRNIHAPGIS
jgi:hypothetical protein